MHSGVSAIRTQLELRELLCDSVLNTTEASGVDLWKLQSKERLQPLKKMGHKSVLYSW